MSRIADKPFIAQSPATEERSLFRRFGKRALIYGIATVSFFQAPSAKAQVPGADAKPLKAWELDLQKPGKKPVEKSEVAGLFGVTKIVGFTKEEKSTFKPITIADSLLSAVADTLGTLPRDVAQSLANCYWAASLHAVLGANPHFLDDRVTRRGTTPKGVPIWRVRLHSTPLLGGRERTVFVEATLPSDHLKATSGAMDLRTMRAMLYEKAFAQALGGYDELEWGNSGRAMRNMTGNPSAYTFMELANPDRLFKKIERRHHKNRPMVFVALDLRDYLGAKKTKEERDPSNYGIVDQHCYSVIGARIEDRDGKPTKVIDLRDPRYPDKTLTKTVEECQKAFFMLVTNHL